MLPNHMMPEGVKVELLAHAVDLATAGLTSLPYVNMTGYFQCNFVFLKKAGGSGQDPVISMQQAQAAAGTGVKALTFENIFTRTSASSIGAGGVEVDTHVTQVAASTWTAAIGNHEAIIQIPVFASWLDRNASTPYAWVRPSVSDPGATAQVMTVLALLSPARHVGAPLRTVLS